MPTMTEPNNLQDTLVWEEDRGYSRDEVVIADGQDLAVAQIVGRIEATGKIVALDPAADTGAQKAVGFTIAKYKADGADIKGVIIAREAIITTSDLVWPDGITDPQKNNRHGRTPGPGYH